jgi:large subunit ribosomal protein L1
MPKKLTKRIKEALSKIDQDRAYEPLEALKLLKETATAKFNETAEAHIRLGIDPKYTDQQLRTGSQNPRCMPRCGLPRKSNRNSIVANDDNYALAA